MDYRKLGKAGVKVSPICLGTAFRGYWHGPHDEATCIRTIEKAVDLGINFIDCANFYYAGRCETLLGKALKNLGGKRDNLVITSKVWSRIGDGPNDQGLSRYHIMREIERSLKRLQIDHIDLYFLPNFDPHTPLEETLSAMDDLVRQGKVRYTGCSNHSAAQIVEGLWISDQKRLSAYTCLQNHYNLLARSVCEPELFPRCRQHGLGMMTFSPLAVGLLSGQFRRGQPPAANSHWANNANFDKALSPEADQVVQALIDIAADLGKTPAQVAFAWILDHPEVTAAMTGPDLPEHVEEVCGSIGWKLDPQARQKLDEVSAFAL